MKKKLLSPLVRAIGVFSAVAVLVGGVTYATLSNQATLTGNTVSTRSVNPELKLWNGSHFVHDAPGFALEDVVPGEESERHSFYFKNNGNAPLDLSVSVPDDPALEGLTAEDVTFTFYGACDDGPDPMTAVSYTLAELTDDTAVETLPCNPLEEGAQGVIGEDETNEANFGVTVTIADTVTLGSDPLTVGPFDLVFDGEAVL